jgi:hypothetical protein
MPAQPTGRMPPSITTQCLWEGREIRDSIYGEAVNGQWDAHTQVFMLGRR